MALSLRASRQPRTSSTSRITTIRAPTPAIVRRAIRVWRSTAWPRGGRRVRTGSSGSSRKDNSGFPSWRREAPAKVAWEYDRGAGRGPRGPKTEPEMKRPEISLAEESGTLPLGGSDPTEALPGAAGPRLVLGRYRLERRLGAGGGGGVLVGRGGKGPGGGGGEGDPPRK